MTLHIDVAHLAEQADDLVASIDRGEEVVLERAGGEVARVRPAPRRPSSSIGEALDAWHASMTPEELEDWKENLDDFERTLNQIREEANRPQPTAWERMGGYGDDEARAAGGQ